MSTVVLAITNEYTIDTCITVQYLNKCNQLTCVDEKPPLVFL